MELQLARLTRGLLDSGYEVAVVSRTCSLPSHPRLQWARVRAPSRPFPLAYPWFFVTGSLAVRRARRGLVHTTGAIVLNRTDVSTIHFCHHGFEESAALRRSSRPGVLYRLSAWLSRRQVLLAERWCYRPARVGRLVPVSDGVAWELRQHFPNLAGAIQTIPNGVDRAVFRPDPTTRAEARAELQIADHELVALFVGGEWERKGLRFAVEAVARRPRWSLLVAGPGDTEAYRRLSEETGAGERVRFLGTVAGPARLYAAADAFVLPTQYEAFPLVALEAAASGLPLLVTRVSGVEDLLVDGENGFFIERDASVIADRLALLEEDTGLRGRMAEAARAATEPYGWDAAVRSYLDLYASLDANDPA